MTRTLRSLTLWLLLPGARPPRRPALARALRRRRLRRERGRRGGGRAGPPHGPHRRAPRAGPPPGRPHLGRPRQHRHRQQGGRSAASRAASTSASPPTTRGPRRGSTRRGRSTRSARPSATRATGGDDPIAERTGVADDVGLRALASPRGSSARWPRRPGSSSAAARGSTSRAASRRTARPSPPSAWRAAEVYEGRVFVDATYEGDLMAKAGVSYHVGREANAVYGETLNGVQTKNATSHQFKVARRPVRRAGRPEERPPARASTTAGPARRARATAGCRPTTSA